jgi:Zn-finger nucleic acid-binding protein
LPADPNLNPLILSSSKDPRFDQRGHDPRYGHHKCKKSWLEEIFD